MNDSKKRDQRFKDRWIKSGATGKITNPKAIKKMIMELLEMAKGVMKFETNFVITRFHNLPVKEKELLYAQVNSADGNDNAEAGSKLLQFIFDDPEGMARSIGPMLNSWIIWPDDVPFKAHYLWLYFKTYLNKGSDGIFAINPIA